MVFGEIKDWQLDSNVKQILVFSSVETKEIFDDSYAALVGKEGPKYASDSNLGAIYKLRAIRRIDNTWFSTIRCGITAVEIWTDTQYYESFNKALGVAAGHLGAMVSNACWDLRGELVRTTVCEVCKEAS